jgi:hypothetical protein
MLSAPAAMTTSCVPDMTACAANWIACCDEPHWRSIVTAGTLSGSFEAKTALRPKAKDCSPAWVTQPMMTSSIAAGSMPAESTSASRTLAARSAGWTVDNRPLRRPPGRRTALTI